MTRVTRLTWRRPDGSRDEGAYAILYAIVMVVVLGVAALVIDVGMVRMDRRANRSATDAAAIIGAGKLGLGGSNPVAACEAAMRYAEVGLGITTPGSDNCASTFAGSPAALCSAGNPLTAQETVDGHTIIFTWPVPDTSTYMTTPDLENWYGTPITQPVQPGVNGTSSIDGTPCIRVGVAIDQNVSTLFGTGLGFGGTQSTQSRSVAVAEPGGGPGQIAAPLVVLDQHACQALNASGGGTGGGVVVNASAALSDGSHTPGVIAVDSDGTQANGVENGTSCQGGGVTISVSNNTRIWALDGTSSPGYILDYALLANNAAHAYTGNTTGCPTSGMWTPPALGPPPNLCRIPQLGARVTDLPWLNRYDCGTTLYTKYTAAGFPCTDPAPPAPPYPTPRNYVDQWQAFAKNVIAIGHFPSGTTDPVPCNISTDMTFNDNAYANCSTLHIKSTAHVVFKGMLVTSGDVSVENTACLMLNDTNTGDCTTLPANVVASSPPPDGQNVYIGGGLSMAAGSSFVDAQSFVFLKGQLDSNAGAQTGSVVSWVAPYDPADSTGCVPATSNTAAPTSGCFNSLSMWSPYQGTNTGASQDFLTGGGNLNVDGTLFMGYSAFNYAGQAANIQNRAQFVARILNLTGGSLLNMTPDGSRSTMIPEGIGQLIR